MNKILILLLFVYIKSIGQISKNIFVYDLATNKPIPFANVMFFKGENIQDGLFTDENGYAKFMLTEDSVLEISCLGYESQRFLNQSNLKDTVFLSPNTTILKEVVLTNKNRVKNIGFNKKKKKSSINTYKGNEFAVFIENESNIKTKIKSVILNLDKKKDCTIILKIKFYKKNSNNIPTDLINKGDIIYYLKNKHNGELEIDIDNKNIELPEDGVFLSIESLGFIDKKGSFINDQDMWHKFNFHLVDAKKNATFTKNNLKANTWYNNLKLRFEEIGEKYDYYPNLSFGLKVYENEN